MIERESLYIGGRWVAPGPTAREPDAIVTDSHDESPLAQVVSAAAEDVDGAVAAAETAQPDWAATAPRDRAAFLTAIADGLERRSGELAETIAREVGTPVAVGRELQVALPVTLLRNAAEIVADFEFEEEVGSSHVIREPVGVVGAITPWNYPLGQVAAKVASALAVGCAVVLKPASEAPLSLFALAEAADDAGLPPGVLNLVPGAGATVGRALATHPGVDAVSFTGSTEVGREIGANAAQTVKRVRLELGGKSPNVILDDADVERAVADGLGRAFLNSGQTCSALTRMLVPRAKLAEVEEAAASAAGTWTVGDPLDDATRLGPLVSERQARSVRMHIERAQADGARLLCGGTQPPDDLPRGFYVQPTIFSNVTNDLPIAREEVFGPVLAIIPYGDEDEAVAIANDSIYGLSAGVWSGDRERAERIARRLAAGQVNVNGGAFNPLAPFGGYKQSGYGRERGKFGLEEFVELKSLQF